MARSFLQYDVFTNEPLTGNQLAVFVDGRDLTAEQMQAIAREMHFSESTFVLPAVDAGTLARVRIFTPGQELPMAGHPTIGTTFALAADGVIAPGTSRVVLGLGIGPTNVDLEWDGGRLRFAWMTQRAPEFGRLVDDRATAAAALGLRLEDLYPDLPVQTVSCGVPFIMIPLRDPETVDRAVSDGSAIRRFAETVGPHGLLLFAPVVSDSAATAYSRMFAPHTGISIAEDPATGSAAGPLGCYLVRHKRVYGPVQQRMINVQGVAMKRPSRIHIAIGGNAEAITSVRVGGEAVLVGRGELFV